MVLACWCWCFKKPRKLPNVEEDAEFHLGKFKKFSLQELEVATESFSNEHIIGRCGFRTFDKVYKGILEDGFLVAIKRLKSQNTAAAEFQFQTVVVTNSMAVHQNLLQLHGLCITPTERLLAYPYMANGSVASHLKDRPPSQPSLDWQIRKRIALGSAKGLSYLRENCNPRIIHCDVKASNIFLNEDFEAFIGDFASAKLIDCKETHITTTVCGTIGYIAPEYLSNGRCSEKIDVYGYGIILLELITGQKAFDLSRLSDFVKRFVKENKLEMLVDPDLQNNYVEAEMEQLIQVALFCTMYQSSYANIGKQAFQRHFSFSEQLLEESLSGASDTSAMAFSCWCCRGPPILSFAEGDRKIHPDPNADVSQLRRFSLEELQLATNYFSNENFLGRGGFGKVYRGQLDDGSLIAVKRLEREPTPGGELQFQTTTEIINMAMHRNVIRLRGFCMTHSERLLVYPYMANGSVASHLRERTASQPALNWPTRKQIALGSAEGLSYLHDECNPRIIHRDVKAANILLDEEFKAVVGDFGLAKLMDYNDTHITTDVYGTPGHIAPEYLYTGICSEKTDVYGYGIMILELITGQRAVDLAWIAAGDDLLLLDWVKVVLKENRLEELADPDLQGNYSQAEMEQLIKVALLCTQGSPLYRPKMSEVTRMLEGYGVAERWNEWLEMESSDVELGVSFQPVSYYVADSTELLAAIELSGPR